MGQRGLYSGSSLPTNQRLGFTVGRYFGPIRDNLVISRRCIRMDTATGEGRPLSPNLRGGRQTGNGK